MNNNIFFFIAQKIVDKESKQIIINIKKQIISSFISSNKYSIKRKFELITETEQNIFYNPTILNDFLNFYVKSKKYILL
jgi:hypothetical protein